ncbi:MAG TPA: hypothetical protein IGS52_22380 [Oscillatoriaceae cyanobacterium M33_DOE_052]|uniref:Uncharacterized protein n=1 Tax=Planktothricoides sp. SpSt-374 TaxID=2282167 RepID=A0A7C3VQH6_9CYAN|nr:hypothetical protein [Oscillatoriaceae cyanobacterium M33_DOE_052]
MNSDNIIESLQTGFRVAVGATASLIEILQDPSKREENLSKLNSDWGVLAEELATKGESTEREARQFVENMWHQQEASPTGDGEDGETGRRGDGETGRRGDEPPAPNATTTADPEIQGELRNLTQQLAALRSELERLQQKDSNPS